MGSGIAAHIANSGHKVLLLDIITNDTDRNILARKRTWRKFKNVHAKIKTLVSEVENLLKMNVPSLNKRVRLNAAQFLTERTETAK